MPRKSFDRTAMSRVDGEYTADSLRLLEGVEHVRHRPAMYIGDTGTAGLHHLMYEIIDNSIDEVLAGRANEIWVTLHKDKSISVRDDGNGILDRASTHRQASQASNSP